MFCILLVFAPATIYAQNPAVAPSQTPGSKPAGSPPKYTQEQMQDMISKLQDRIQKAADAVIGKIQKEEAGIRLKFTYLRKPARLDPNTFGSKEDITTWRDSLQQFISVTIEKNTGFRQVNPPADPSKKRDPEFGLQLMDLIRHIGLADVKFLSSPGKVCMSSHRLENPETCYRD